jgi:RNA polymerase sigma-70 factor (ECF subfamily)
VNATLETLRMMAEAAEESPSVTSGNAQSSDNSPTNVLEAGGDLQEGECREVPNLRGRFASIPPLNGPPAGARRREVGPAGALRSGPPSKPGHRQTRGSVSLKEFDALYRRHARRVYWHCYRMMKNPEDAEDLTQEVFLQLFRKINTFRGDANFSTWLHRLTVNAVLMRIRSHHWWRERVTSWDVGPGAREGLSDVFTMVSDIPAPELTTVDRIGLDIAIAQLPSGYKTIFLLHDWEGYRHDEIGRMLGITEGTSKSQLHKARMRLRELMQVVDGRTADFDRASPTYGHPHEVMPVSRGY